MTTTSTSALTFNGVELNTISLNNQIWMTSVELAKALGYAHDTAITKLFNRNKDEFSASMTTVLPATQNGSLGESSGLQRTTRIFSLRGCHLISMFANTQIAKKFRVWVLDILDKEVEAPKPKYGLFDQLEIPDMPRPAIQPCHPSMMDSQRKNHIRHFVDLIAGDNNCTTNRVFLDMANYFYADSWELIPAYMYHDICAYLNIKPRFKAIPKDTWIMVEASSLEMSSRVDLAVKLDGLQKEIQRFNCNQDNAEKPEIKDVLLNLGDALKILAANA